MFQIADVEIMLEQMFPSPCGVWVVSQGKQRGPGRAVEFPSPCGVWVVSRGSLKPARRLSFRPLAGCGLFRNDLVGARANGTVSVPLRGVGCFDAYKSNEDRREVSVPLRGVGCFETKLKGDFTMLFPSPCGVWVVSNCTLSRPKGSEFPSPCGVWVVS